MADCAGAKRSGTEAFSDAPAALRITEEARLWTAREGRKAAATASGAPCGKDRFLRATFGGYAEYAARVRYRLIPGVW